MSEIYIEDTKKFLGSPKKWTLVDMDELPRWRLNKLLDNEELQEEYHKATMAAAGVVMPERAENLLKFTKERGEKFVLPCRNGIFEDNPRKKWAKYSCGMCCHWMSKPNAMLAGMLFPKQHWGVYCTEGHTSAINFRDKLFFDPWYSYSGIDTAGIFKQFLCDSSDGFYYESAADYDYEFKEEAML